MDIWIQQFFVGVRFFAQLEGLGISSKTIEMDDIPAFAMAYSNSLEISPSTLLLWGTAVVCLFVLGAGIWLAVADIRRREDAILNPSAQNLFLQIKYNSLSPKAKTVGPDMGQGTTPVKSAASAPMAEAILRQLGTREVAFLSGSRLPKHSLVQLNLSSLPDFPEADINIMAEVRGCRMIGNQSYLISAKLPDINEATKKPLLSYIRGLTSGSALNHDDQPRYA